MIAHEYRPDKDSPDDAYFTSMDQMVADSDFVCNTEQFAQALAANGNNVYRYFYAERSSTDLWPSYTGVKHGDELEFTFGGPLNDPREYDLEEVSLARKMVTYWSNFARNGSPNPSVYLNSWPKYKSPDWMFMNFTAKVTKVDREVLAERCEFWNEVLPHFTKEDKSEDEKEDEEEEDDDVDFDACKA